MKDEVMMHLGDEYEFKISTAAYQSLKQATDYRWTESNRIGNRPSLQFLGVGRHEVTLSGVIYPEFAGGLDQVSKLRAEAEKGVPLLLVAGNGEVLGYFCIVRINDSASRFWVKGIHLKQEFSLTLRVYGDDV